MLAWFDAARADLLVTFAELDPRARLPWFGPAMSAESALTARLMETWAHTQDIADALGVSREPTGGLGWPLIRSGIEKRPGVDGPSLGPDGRHRAGL